MILKIITVVKNDLVGLERTKQSILDQSKKVSWTLVTPNDGSTTFQYVHELRNNGIADEIILDTHQGIYAAMNQAITLSSGEDWLWFLNAGDKFANSSTYELVDKYAQSSSNLWIYGGHFLGSHAGKILGEVKTPQKFKPTNQLFAKNFISHQASVFKSNFLKELEGFNQKFHIAADWDLLVRASKVDSGERLDEPLVVFFLGGLSSTNKELGNRELLEIRKTQLDQSYFLPSYFWYLSRRIRNQVVDLGDKFFPRATEFMRIYKIRITNRFTRLK